jgi:hypothetical protein
MLLRYLSAVGLFAIVALDTPASAVTATEKMETCNFGADAQKLAGAARKRFIARCMADSDAPAKRAAKKTPPS